MQILGLEQSSNQNSIALLRDNETLVEDRWDGRTSRNQEFFSRVEAMLSSASITVKDIDMFAVGLGPGSFTGVRMALSAVNAMAQPDFRTVIGVGSADSIAEAVIKEHGVDTVAVVGDARRDRFWCATFSAEAGLPVVRSECCLVPKEEIEMAVANADLVFSPEWDRVSNVLTKVAEGRCIEKSKYPDAVSCARLARSRGASESPTLPIYLHPAVVKR